MDQEARVRPDSGDVTEAVFNWNDQNTAKKASREIKKKKKDSQSHCIFKVIDCDPIWWRNFQETKS